MRIESEAQTDGDLLRLFAERGDEAAFGSLVMRHSGLVRSIAMRRTGSPELAQEAAQNVFTSLARKAPRLAVGGSLAPWLHRAAVLETAALLRRETRYRHAMERQRIDASVHSAASSAPCDWWEVVRPVVDDALNALSEPDRCVLLLHHVEGRTYAEIAQKLGLTEAAAQRRGYRALQKLATRLRRRGVPAPVLALGGVLATGLAGEAAAASGGAASLATTALTRVASAHSGAGSIFSGWGLHPLVMPGVVLCAAAIPMVWRGVWHAATVPRPGTVNTSVAVAAAAVTPSVLSTPVNAEDRLSFLRLALEKLSRTPPDEVPTKLGLQLRRYLLSLPPEDLRPVGALLSGALLSGASRSHPEIRAVIQAFSTRLAELEPRLALELAQATSGKHPDADFNRSIDKLSLLEVLTRRNLADVLSAARADPDFGFYMLGRWASHDPLGAIVFSGEQFSGGQRIAGVNKCFRTWLAYDPIRAIAWLDAHQEHHEMFLSAADPENSAVRSLPAGQAAALATSIKDPLLRDALVEQAYRTYAQSEPEALVALAPFLRLEEKGRSATLAQWLRAWRRLDAAAAAVWVAHLPDGDLKSAAQHSLAAPEPDASL